MRNPYIKTPAGQKKKTDVVFTDQFECNFILTSLSFQSCSSMNFTVVNIPTGLKINIYSEYSTRLILY